MKLSVFTVCMPEYTPEEAAPKLKKWGYEGVEWRVTTPPEPGAPVQSFWSGNRCTISPDTIVDEVPRLRALGRDAGLATPVLGTYLSYLDTDRIDACLAAAKKLGCSGIRVGIDHYDGKTHYDKAFSASVKGWEKAVALAAKYKVKVLAELHMGNIIPSASAAFRFASNFDPKHMGVIYDPGNMVHEGFENWQLGCELLGKYLAHVHVKNASWSIVEGEKDGNLRWRPASDTLRRGRANWRDIIRALVAVKYDGWLSLEDFAPGNTEAKLKDDAKYLKRLLREEAG